MSNISATLWRRGENCVWSAQETWVQVPVRECAMVVFYFYMNCNVKYKCDFPVHYSGHPGGTMQVIRSVDQGLIPGPPIYVVSSCVLWSNTSATSLQVLNRNVMWIVRSSITSHHSLPGVLVVQRKGCLWTLCRLRFESLLTRPPRMRYLKKGLNVSRGKHIDVPCRDSNPGLQIW